MTGLYGGVFDPPHNAHVALVRAAREHFRLDRLVILVAEKPGHKPPEAAAEVRMRMARAAFPELDVELDPYARTIDMLRAREWDDPIFFVGADQLQDLSTWKEPEEVLRLTRLAVATRPGYSPAVESDRIEVFEMAPLEISSSDVRRRVAAGEPIDGFVPPAVAELIAELGVYRR
jgi:nicotinate-nucleotide adenylyltransferase